MELYRSRWKSYSASMNHAKPEYEKLRQTVLAKLSDASVCLDVVTMPDFFLDNSLTCNVDARVLTRRILSVASRGGGEISDIPQSLGVGGNAAICTLALANLGASVHLLIKTDALGLLLLQYFCTNLSVDLTRVKLTGSLSPTTILELRNRKASTNVMLGDAPSITPFGFEDLDFEDLAIIGRAHYVCVFNWLYNTKGTDLAEKVFKYCRMHSGARTFFDASDPRPRISDLPDLNQKVLRSGLVDVLGVNENEALLFAALYKRRLKRNGHDDRLNAARTISARVGAKVCLHTADYSALVSDAQSIVVPAFAVTPKRGTGAGDSWNAGIMVAGALGLTEEEGLFFANAVAARYVSNPKRVYSTLNDMVKFLMDPALRLKRNTVS